MFTATESGTSGLTFEGLLELDGDGRHDLRIGGRRLSDVLRKLQLDGEIVRLDLRIYDLDEESGS